MNLLRLLALAILICVVIGNKAYCQTDQTIADSEWRIAELEASVAELQNMQQRSRSRCCTPVMPSQLYAGYSFLFAKLHFQESFRAMVVDNATGTLNLVPFETDYEITPRIWMGYRGERGLGVRTTYWSYDHNDDRLTLVNDGLNVPQATSTTVIFPALISTALPGDRLTVDNSMEATSFDLEATYDARIQRAELNLRGGLRYIKVEQTFDAAVLGGPVPGVVPASLNWSREFEGVGPTMTADMKLPIGSRGLYGKGSAGLSFLFGEKTLARSVVNDVTPIATPPNVLLNDADEITGVYQASVGLGWERRTNFGEVFIESMYESQLWTAGGAPTLTFMGFNGFSLNLGVSI